MVPSELRSGGLNGHFGCERVFSYVCKHGVCVDSHACVEAGGDMCLLRLALSLA